MSTSKGPDFSMRNVENFRNHIGMKAPGFVCPLCGAEILSAPSLRRHIRSKHPDQSERLGALEEPDTPEWILFREQASQKNRTPVSPRSLRSSSRRESGSDEKSSSLQPHATTFTAVPGRTPKNMQAVPLDALLNPAPSPQIGQPSSRTPSTLASRKREAEDQATHLRPRSYVPADAPSVTSGWSQNPEPSQTSLPVRPERDLNQRTQGHTPGILHIDPRQVLSQTKSSLRNARNPSQAGPQPQPSYNQEYRWEAGVLSNQRHRSHGQYNMVEFECEAPLQDDVGNETGERRLPYLRQPLIRQITHDELVVEVKSIYKGLISLESKAIEVDDIQMTSIPPGQRGPDDEKTPGGGRGLLPLTSKAILPKPVPHETEARVWQSERPLPQPGYSERPRPPEAKLPPRYPELTPDKYRSLIALHKQLLHEHHDFFLASQHPAATPNLSGLAGKYAMAGRMWKHGVHRFLEVLRVRLPHSSEHMLAFIYISYSMLTLLYETVPVFESTWIECLGDLSRYRVTVEPSPSRDREKWIATARYWYLKALIMSQTQGRIFHHLAVLARDNSNEQLSLFLRALIAVEPFHNARLPLLATMYEPLLAGNYKTGPVNGQQISKALVEFQRLNIELHAYDDRDDRQGDAKCYRLQAQVIPTMERYISEATAALRRQSIVEKWQIGRELCFFMICAISGALDSGALGTDQMPRSLIRRSLDRLRNETAPSKGLDPKSTTSQRMSSAPGQGDYYMTPPEGLDLATSRARTLRNCRLIARIVNHAAKEKHWTPTSGLGPANEPAKPGETENHYLPLLHTALVFYLGLLRTQDAALHQYSALVNWRLLCALANWLLEDPKVAIAQVTRPEPLVTKEGMLTQMGMQNVDRAQSAKVKGGESVDSISAVEVNSDEAMTDGNVASNQDTKLTEADDSSANDELGERTLEEGAITWEELQFDGSIFATHYVSHGLCAKVDIDDRDFESPSMDLWRKRKLLWIFHRMAEVSAAPLEYLDSSAIVLLLLFCADYFLDRRLHTTLRG